MSDALARGRFLKVAGGAAAGTLAPYVARAQTLTPLRVLIAPSDGVTAVVWAKHAGLFEQAGLDVSLDQQHNGAAVAAGVVSGSYDIGNSSMTSLLIAHAKGLPFSLVAPAGIYADAKIPFSGALVLRDSTLRFNSDINNQTLGVVSLNGIGQETFCAYIDEHGGDWQSVKFVEIPFAATAVALISHRIAAAESVTPTLTQALATGNFRFVKIYSSIAPTYLISAWFTTRDFSAKNADVVRRFSRVVSESAAYCNAHHAETAPVMAEFIGIALTDLQNMPRAIEGRTLNPTLIQPLITMAAKYGNLGKTFPAQEMIDQNALG